MSHTCAQEQALGPQIWLLVGAAEIPWAAPRLGRPHSLHKRP